MNHKILIVDDEAANLRLLERLFQRQYEVFTAASGIEALEVLRQHDISLIISDQRMPVMTGIEFLKRASELRQHTVRIILTGYTDVNALVEAINSGVVYKYVTKPWINEDLQQTVQRALQHYETTKNQYRLKLQNERLQAQMRMARENFVKLIVEFLHLKDVSIPGHLRRTRDYAVAAGKCLYLDAQELEQLSLAAFLHEIVHIGVPNHILFKPTALTAEEQSIIKQNFERGLQMLDVLPNPENVASAIRYQHESFDGKGYPEGLAGERIPLNARIIAVADAYDKMRKPHILQPGITHGEAIEELLLASGRKFDPQIVKVFCDLQLISETDSFQLQFEEDCLVST